VCYGYAESVAVRRDNTGLVVEERVLHPHPQLARSRWTDLTGVWSFAYDDEDRGRSESWQSRPDVFVRSIVVPFPPESPASGIGDTGFHPVIWYRRTFEVAPQDAGKQIILHFGAVDYRAQVWVNEMLVVEHEGGHTPFGADITDVLHTEAEHTIVVRVEDIPADLSQPRGKQDWLEQPHAIWYHRSTGIWQPVWLEPVSANHITGLRWTPDVTGERVDLTASLVRERHTSLSLQVRLALHGRVLANDAYSVEGTELRRAIALDTGTLTTNRDHILWSPEHPHLIEATACLMDRGEVVDEVQSYFGLRSIGIAQGRFLLNDRPYYLRFALEQGYWPESHLAAPSIEALRHEVELAKELGFNGLRVHQKVEDPRFLYWCDRLGLLIWGEMANAYVFSPPAAGRLVREWMEVLARDYSHPCIAAWVPLNESWGAPNLLHDVAQRHLVQSLYHLTKALDPTRPVIANDGWEYVLGDVIGIHDYSFDGTTLHARYGSREALERTLHEAQPGGRFIVLLDLQDGVPIALSEFGGISCRPDPGTEWFGYGTVTSLDAYIQKYRELLEAVLDCPTLAGFCYTQLTDTAQETNGLLTAEREAKVDATVVRAITQSDHSG
jgi:beta-galactosidase/beta-glucuronidase